MTVTMANVNYMWTQVIMPRQGDVYVFGGSLSPTAVQQGTDCSGAVSEVNEALLYGPQMNWLRQFWTGTFAGANPGDQGPFGGVPSTADWVCIADPRNPPPGAVMTVAVLQLADPSSAHMVCAVQDPDNVTGFGGPGVYVGIESGGQFTDPNGNSTLHIGPLATGVDDPEFNQYFALTDTIADAPPPPSPPVLTPQQQNALTVIAAGEAMGITPLGCQMALACALDESSMLMYANSTVPESLTYPHDAIGNNGASCGPFQQQAQFGWGTVQCEMDWTCSATLFFTALAKLPYNSGGQTPWMYIQDVQRSATADGSNYQAQWTAAADLYNSVINIPPGDDMAAVPQAEWNAVRDAVIGPIPSQSPFRALGEGAVWEPSQLWLNDDGMTHPQYVEWAALRGDPVSLAVLNTLAAGSVVTYPDRVEDIRLAQQVLARIAAGGGSVTPPVSPTPVPGPTPPNPAPAPAPTPTPAAPGTMTISVTQLVQWGKDLLTVLGALGTWATAVHGVLGQYLPGTSGAVVPATLAAATVGFSAHTVGQKRVAQKQLAAMKGS
jgi:hypothetical protein